MKKITMYETEDGRTFTSEKEAKQHEERLNNGKCYDVEFAITGTVVVNDVYAFSKEEAIAIARTQVDVYNDDCITDWELGEVTDVWE